MNNDNKQVEVEREAFEEAFRRIQECCDLPLTRAPNGTYADTATDAAWLCWLARSAASQPSVAVGQDDARDAARYRWLRDAARESLPDDPVPLVMMVDQFGKPVPTPADVHGILDGEELDAAVDAALSTAPASEPVSKFGSPEMQAMIVARAIEKSRASEPVTEKTWRPLNATDIDFGKPLPFLAGASEPVKGSDNATYTMRTRPLDSMGRVNGDWSEWTPITAEQYKSGGNRAGLECEYSSFASEPVTAKCPECYGDGVSGEPSDGIVPDVAYKCPTCNGTGTAPATPQAASVDTPQLRDLVSDFIHAPDKCGDSPAKDAWNVLVAHIDALREAARQEGHMAGRRNGARDETAAQADSIAELNAIIERLRAAQAGSELEGLLYQALDDAVIGQGSYSKNYDGNKLAAAVRAALAKKSGGES